MEKKAELDLNVIIDKYVITFSLEALKRISSFSKPTDLETGGIIIGQTKDTLIHITDIIGPFEDDEKKRFTYIRSSSSANKTIKKEFKLSEGRNIYLGEWHTHHEEYPNPSSQDKNNIVDIAKTAKLNIDIVLMLILGYKGMLLSVYKDKKFYEKMVNFI